MKKSGVKAATATIKAGGDAAAAAAGAMNVKTVATSNDARTGNNKHVIQLIATGGVNRKQANIAT